MPGHTERARAHTRKIISSRVDDFVGSDRVQEAKRRKKLNEKANPRAALPPEQKKVDMSIFGQAKRNVKKRKDLLESLLKD